MIAIYRKELKLSFSALSTYILYSLLLLSFGILSVLFNLFLGYASLSYPLGYMTLFLAILLPFFVFFSTRREQKGNMQSLIFSLPVSPALAVLGSFLGQLTMFLIPTALLSLLPLLFSLFGNSLIPTSEIALLGYFLYAILLLSVNRLLFATIQRPFISLASAVLLNLALYLLNLVYFYLPLDGIWENILSLFNPTGIYYSLTYGKFNLPGVIYFVTLTAFFVFCEILVRKRARGDLSNKKRGARATCVLAVMLVLLLLSNTLLTLLPEKISNVDVTGNDVFRISNTTLETLENLDSPVEIYLLCAGGRSATDKDFLSFLKGYAEESDQLTLTVIDTEQNPSFSLDYTSKKLSDQSLIVKGNGRYKILDRADLYHYENPQVGVLSSADYEYLLQSYMVYMQTGSMMEGATEQSISLGYQLYLTASSTVAYFDGDSLLCNAIRFADEDRIPSVYIATADTFTSPDKMLRDVLTENGFFVKELPLLGNIPADCDALILFSPKKDLTEVERDALSDYLSSGGKLFLTTDYSNTEHPLLLSLLTEYGLGVASVPNVICDANERTHISEDSPYFFLTKIASSPATGSDFSGVYASIFSHCITLKETEGVTLTPWLTTTEEGYLRDPVEAEKIEEGVYCCGAIAEKKDATLIWISSPLSVSSTGYVASEGGNFLLFLSAFRWMCDADFEKLSIAPTTVTSAALSLSNGDLAIWTLVIAVILPLIPISIGIIYTYVRKKR